LVRAYGVAIGRTVEAALQFKDFTGWTITVRGGGRSLNPADTRRLRQELEFLFGSRSQNLVKISAKLVYDSGLDNLSPTVRIPMQVDGILAHATVGILILHLELCVIGAVG
jgi:hypothetical protein